MASTMLTWSEISKVSSCTYLLMRRLMPALCALCSTRALFSIIQVLMDNDSAESVSL